MKSKHYDLFVSHINSDAISHDIRGYISDNGIDVSKMRIDITSHKEADYKSFRLIGPVETKNINEEASGVQVNIIPEATKIDMLKMEVVTIYHV